MAAAGRRVAAASPRGTAAADAPRKSKMGLVVGLTVTLIAAAAGVAYVVMGNSPF